MPTRYTQISLNFDEQHYLDSMQAVADDLLIQAYVPNADQMSREAALELALQRDLAAAEALLFDVIGDGPSAMG